MSEKSRSDFTPVPKVSVVPPMRYETPLVPRNSISGRALVAVVAIMTFLASLTTGGVILVSQAATAWQADVSREVTVQLIPAAGRDIDVGRDFVVAGRIEESFTQAVDALDSPDVAVLLRRLGDCVKTMSQALPRGQQEEAAQDLNVLAVEAGRARPRREWVALAGEGLTGLAKTANQPAVPELVDALLRELGARDNDPAAWQGGQEEDS